MPLELSALRSHVIVKMSASNRLVRHELGERDERKEEKRMRG